MVFCNLLQVEGRLMPVSDSKLVKRIIKLRWVIFLLRLYKAFRSRSRGSVFSGCRGLQECAAFAKPFSAGKTDVFSKVTSPVPVQLLQTQHYLTQARY